MKVIVTTSEGPREIFKFLTEEYHQYLAPLIKIYTSAQYPKLKKEGYDQRNLQDLRHYCVCGSIDSAKLNFMVKDTLHTSNSFAENRLYKCHLSQPNRPEVLEEVLLKCYNWAICVPSKIFKKNL